MAIESLREKVVRLPVGNQKDAQARFLPPDRVEYMVDMLQQLKEMAAAGNLQVLSGIIEVAYQEARARSAAPDLRSSAPETWQPVSDNKHDDLKS